MQVAQKSNMQHFEHSNDARFIGHVRNVADCEHKIGLHFFALTVAVAVALNWIVSGNCRANQHQQQWATAANSKPLQQQQRSAEKLVKHL